MKNEFSPGGNDTFDSMDRMYGVQRYFYDVTRKFYLLGRDELLREMNVLPGETILEIGCGTGRNLAILAKRHPAARFFGLDASQAMLETADAKFDRMHLRNVTLARALADDFYYNSTFDLTYRLDKIFFSYSISMIPPWRAAIENALSNLRPGGEMFIVDFFDQRDLPRSFRAMLTNWLRAFHVQFWSELLPYMNTLATQGLGTLTVKPLYRRYCFIAKFAKS